MQQHRSPTGATVRLQALQQAGDEGIPVRQAGEQIAVGQAVETRSALDALADVTAGRDKMRDLAKGITDRRDRLLFVKYLAALALVGKDGAEYLAAANGSPQVGEEGGRVVSGIQQIGRSTNCFPAA